uniref:NTF2 domain-containing protein n=1 Tax=viral metagenome TaxID=1070528 RepID=A0A6C0LSS8_9ZZZZ
MNDNSFFPISDSMEMCTSQNFVISENTSMTITSNQNANYEIIAINFLIQFTNNSSQNIINTFYHFDDNLLSSLTIHSNNFSQLFELIGSIALLTKLLELGITTIKYHRWTHTSQPIEKHNIHILFFGNIEINNKYYDFNSSFVLDMSNDLVKVKNYDIHIFI